MKYLNLETFSDFVCTGSDCMFTCCGGGWNIYIDNETHEFYKSVTGEMGERLKNNIETRNGHACFVLNEHKNCPFLNDRKLCDIYINLGEEHLSNTCTYYPRYAFRSGDISFAGVSISCPEVSEFFFCHSDPLMIDYAEDDKPVLNENNIDWNLFNHAIRVFTKSVDIAQNRNLTISERLALLNVFINRFQSCVDEESDPDPIINLFSDPSSYVQILPDTGIYETDYNSKIAFVSEILNCFSYLGDYRNIFPEPSEFNEFFRNPENVQISETQWVEAFASTCGKENRIWQEQILVYVLFRYFMQGFDDHLFLDRFMIGQLFIFTNLICILSLYHIRENKTAPRDYRIMLAAHASRLIEHSSETAISALARFKEKGMTELPFLLKLIS